MASTLEDPQQLGDQFLQDPMAVYDRLRASGPVHRAVMPSGMTVWLVTDYEQARQAMADPALSKDNKGAAEIFRRHTPKDDARGEFNADLSAHMLNSDPPDHTRLRNLVNRAFTTGAVRRIQPRVEQLTGDLLDAMQRKVEQGAEEVDLLADFAFPLPITVICELLGVPVDDRDDFREWSNAVVSGANRRREHLEAAANALAAYIAALIDNKRQNPAEDMLSELISASEDGDRLDETELISMVFLLLIAGHETTVNLIGNGVLALLRNPDQLELLRNDPSLITNAIEEFLRYQGPLNVATFRYTAKPCTIGEVTVPKGEFVLVSLLAANRDPERYADPDQLDVTRSARGHMAFGHGIHFCVGAPLARLEGQIAVRELLARLPAIGLSAEPETLRWRESTLMRGLETLPVSLV
jgi:cytochrome P450